MIVFHHRSLREYVDETPYSSKRPEDRGWLATFGFRHNSSNTPLICGGVNYPHWVDSDEQGGGLIDKLQRKAKRRKRLPPHHHITAFVVAIDNHEADLGPITILSQLTGSRHWHGLETGVVSALSEDVRNLISSEWNPVLPVWDYKGTPGMVMTDHGHFHTARADWAGELSGVRNSAIVITRFAS